jgi:hypothetical protein
VKRVQHAGLMDHVESKAEVTPNVVCVCVWLVWRLCGGNGRVCGLCGGWVWWVLYGSATTKVVHHDCCSVCARVRVRDTGMLEKDNEHVHALSFVIIGVCT